MKEYLKLTLYATLTVILCLARSGHGVSDALMDYKRDSRPAIRSAVLNPQALKAILSGSGLTRDRAYFVDPSLYQQQKRQVASVTALGTGLGILASLQHDLLREIQIAKQRELNRQLMTAGGKR